MRMEAVVTVNIELKPTKTNAKNCVSDRKESEPHVYATTVRKESEPHVYATILEPSQADNPQHLHGAKLAVLVFTFIVIGMVVVTATVVPLLSSAKDSNINTEQTAPSPESSTTPSTNKPPQVAVAWGRWTEWEDCDVTCGGGVRSRSRVCNNLNTEQNAGSVMCAGRPNDVETCSDWKCPDCQRICITGMLNEECDACVCVNATLIGRVFATGQRPLSGVTIAYADRPYIRLAETNSSGAFEIQGVCPVETSMVISKHRYATIFQTTSPVDSATTSLIISMERLELPFILKHPDDTIRVEGGNVTFCCLVDDESFPTKWEWFKDGDILEVGDNADSRLTLVNVSVQDSGSYSCRVHNEAGRVYSDSASFVVTTNVVECDPDPIPHIIRLPQECIQPETNTASFDVGTCSLSQCGGRRQNSSQCEDQEKTYCQVADTQAVNINCNDYFITVLKVISCDCLPRQKEFAAVYGVAYSEKDYPLYFGSIFLNNKKIGQTNENGRFSLQNIPIVSRVALTFKDDFVGLLQDTTKVISVIRQSNLFLSVKMKERPKHLLVNGSVIRLLGEEFSQIAEFILPPKSVYDINGDLYTGQLMLSLMNIDLRRESDLDFVEGDFTAIDDDGEVVTLKSFGMFSINLFNPSGHLLSIGGSVPIHIKSNDVTNGDFVIEELWNQKLWVLNRKSGFWEEVSDVVSGIGWIEVLSSNLFNIASVSSGNICVAKVIPYASGALLSDAAGLENTKLKTIAGRNDSQALGGRPIFWIYTSYYFGEQVGECVRLSCDSNSNRVYNYISASIGETNLHPASINCLQDNGPCISQNSLTEEDLSILNIDTSDKDRNFVLNPKVDQLSDSGPLYPWNDRRRCQLADATSKHFQFYLDSDLLAINSEPKASRLTRCSFYPPWVDRPCMIRLQIVSQKYDALRITVASSATNTDIFPGGQCPVLLYGTRHVIARKEPTTNQTEACVEYKCSGGQVLEETLNGLDVLGVDYTSLEVRVHNIDGMQLTCSVCTERSGFIAVTNCDHALLPTTPFSFLVPSAFGSTTGLYTGQPQGYPPFVSRHNIENCKTSAGTTNNALKVICP